MPIDQSQAEGFDRQVQVLGNDMAAHRNVRARAAPLVVVDEEELDAGESFFTELAEIDPEVQDSLDGVAE